MSDLQQEMQESLENGEFDPFVSALTETVMSMVFKWIWVYLIAFVRIVFNWPMFIFGIVNGLLQYYGSDYKIDWSKSVYVYLAVLLYLRVKGLARKYIIMEKIPMVIWFANFLPEMKNPGYSKKKAEEYEAWYRESRDEKFQQLVDQYNEQLKQYQEATERSVRMLQSTATFPDEFFGAIVRMVDLMTCAKLGAAHPRYNYTMILDCILSELCSSQNIPNVHQATIYLHNNENELEIVASRNLKESVVLSKRIKPGESFTGKVFHENETVWIPDILDQSAQAYGFDGRIRPYRAIAGFPIKGLGEGSENIGVISLHFREITDFTNEEKQNIQKLIDVVKQFVLYTIYFYSHENGGIMITKPSVKWGVQVAAAKVDEEQ